MNFDPIIHSFRSLAVVAALGLTFGLGGTSPADAQTESLKALQQRGYVARGARTPRVPGGILKKGVDGARPVAKHVRIHKGTRLPGAGYSPTKTLGSVVRQGDAARRVRDVSRAADTARNAKKTADAARKAQNAAKVAKIAKVGRTAGKLAVAGTGVGAVAGLAATAAGVDPVELALLKKTDPAAYKAKMEALKKNPLKYMGNNIEDNTKKVGAGVKKFGDAAKSRRR